MWKRCLFSVVSRQRISVAVVGFKFTRCESVNQTRKFSEFFDPYPTTRAMGNNGQYLTQAVSDGDLRAVEDALSSGVNPNFQNAEVFTILVYNFKVYFHTIFTRCWYALFRCFKDGCYTSDVGSRKQ